MSSTDTPRLAAVQDTDDALCLRQESGDGEAAIRLAPNMRDGVSSVCRELCEGRPDLLAHAMFAERDGEPLEPLGTLFGYESINHGELASAIFRLGHEGTALTSAALRSGAPVWTATIPRLGWKGLGRVLRDHGVKSAGAFPVVVGERVAAVIEVLSLDELSVDLATDALVGELAAQLAALDERLRLSATA